MAIRSTIQATKLLADVKRQFGDADNVQISDANILDWGNQAQRQVVSDLLTADTVVTSKTIGGQANYDIPDNCYQIKNIVVGKLLLKSMSFENAIAQFGVDMGGVGTPDIFYTWESSIILYPTPREAFDMSVFYCKAPDLLLNSGSFMGVPDRYYNAVLQLTLSYVHEMDEQVDLSSLHISQYQKSKEALVNQEGNKSGAFPVVTDPWYDSLDNTYGWF